MTPPQQRFSREEFARRGQNIYEHVVKPTLQPDDEDKFVAIDMESSAFAIDRDDYSATESLLVQHPDAAIWLVRVGQPAAYRIGKRLDLGAME